MLTRHVAVSGETSRKTVSVYAHRYAEDLGRRVLAERITAKTAETHVANLERGKTRGEPALTVGAIRALREDVPKGDIVFSDDATAYRIGAYAPVYVNAGPPSHVVSSRGITQRAGGRRREKST